jgi:hypothetical protein
METRKPAAEARKRVRGLFGLWKTVSKLEREYPHGMIMLMDSSAPFDILVVDAEIGSIVAVEVKSAASSSRASRRLSFTQKELKKVLGSRPEWKVELVKYVVYGEPGSEASSRIVR